jgi:hypothetical protein
MYKDLLEYVQNLEDEQLDMTVMVDIDDELYPAENFKICEDNSRLEDGHPYLIIT